MGGSVDVTGLLDARSRMSFFGCEIVCQDQPLETKLQFALNFYLSETRPVCTPTFGMGVEHISSLGFLTSSSVATFRGPNSDTGNGVCFAALRQAREIIELEALYSHPDFPNTRRDASSEGERCMKNTDHPIVHFLVHRRIFGRVRSRRSCAWHHAQFGRGQNTGLGWSDPTFAHVSVPKVIRGVAPAQLRGDLAECFVRAAFLQQRATVTNNGDENHTELLTVHEIAGVLRASFLRARAPF